MSDNKVSTSITADQRTAIAAAIHTIEVDLPGLITLTTDQRVRALKVDGSGVDFVNRIYDVATHNQQYIPAAFDMAEWSKDVAYYGDLREIADMLKPLLDSIEDTLMEVGAEAYTGGLAVYQYLKNSHVDTDLDKLLDEVGRKFARKAKVVPPVEKETA